MNFKGLSICFIAGTLGVGGAERQLFHIISMLQKGGAKVSLVSIQEGEFWEDRIKKTGISYYTLSGQGNPLQRLLKITSIIRKIKPGLIQSQHFYTNLYASVAGRILGIPTIGASRNELTGEIKANGRLGKLCLSLPDYFIANSMESVQLAKQLRKGDSNSIFYLPNALDLSGFHQKQGNAVGDPFVFLAIGRAAPQKRFERYIQMIADLKKEGYPVRGIHLGDGSLLPELKDLARSLGLTENEMVFKGKVPDPENYYIQADGLVLTSDYEGTPNVVLEAMASRLPVIVPEVGNLPYFIRNKHNGLFFDKEDRGSLADAGRLLMSDRALAASIAGEGYQTVMNMFSLEALPLNLENIYTDICDREGITRN